ncbi:MAG: hypothetical protein V3S56_06270 [Gemmatimonadota bacterium]
MNVENASPQGGVVKKRMPTGMKLAIGCIVVFFAAIALLTVVLGVGGFWLRGKADKLVGGLEDRVEAQAEATTILDRLAMERPFTAPGDGRIDPQSAERFFEATDLAWVELRPLMSDMATLYDRDDEQTGLREAILTIRASSEFVGSRVHLARALDSTGLSLSEYIWTGSALRRAWNDSSTLAGALPRGNSVANANIELARRYGNRLSETDPAGETANPFKVLDLAMTWSRGLPMSQ